MPLVRRMPKERVSRIFLKRYMLKFKLQDLNRFAPGTVVTPELLIESGLCEESERWD